MFKWVNQKIVGGETGKRESALMVFFIWLIGVISVDVCKAYGVELVFIAEVCRQMGLYVIAWIGAAYGMQWYKPNGLDTSNLPPQK